MNIMNKVTLRHLKENKRRTLVTIIGVIISVAMVMAVATLSVSFLDLMIKHTIAETGEWHVQYKNVNKEQLQTIENDEATDKVVLVMERGYASLPGAESNSSKPYLFFKDFNERGLKEFPIELKEGRLPQTENEVVVTEELINDFGTDFTIGKEIAAHIGDRNIGGLDRAFTQYDPLQTDENGVMEELKIKEKATFTIVGVINRPAWEYNWSPGYTVVGYVGQNRLNAGGMVDAAVTVKKLDRSIYEHAEELAEKNNIESFQFHSELLRYHGVTANDNLRNTLYSLAGIIIAVIIIGSVALIYNAFAISVSERARYLGMLSSVGATKKQKRNSVIFEGAVIGAISIPLGIMAGIGGISVTFQFINSFIEDALGITEKLSVIVTPGSVIAACIISLVTIFISTYIPARRASKISPIDAIRQTQDVKLTGKVVKTSKLIRKIFGIEAEIGLKNLKRNKRRYTATVFSLVISIVLFLTVSFFTDSLKKSLDLSQDALTYDIQVAGKNSVDAKDFMPMTKLDSITNWSIVEELYLTALVEEADVAEKLKEQVGELELHDGKYRYEVFVLGLDGKSFFEYAKKVGANIDKWQDPDYMGVIVIDEVVYQDYEKGRVIETKSIHKEVGDVLELYTMDYDTGEQNYLNKVEIAALTNEIPMGGYTSGLGTVSVIVHEKTLDAMMNNLTDWRVHSYLYLESSDPMATQDALKEMKSPDMNVYNLYESRKQSEQLVLLMSVFTYGFIILISLISIANIFNTISTSISLRKREFAMLRSVGMTPKGFNKMMNYESAFYGIKALLYGLPISFAVMLLIYRAMNDTFEYGFILPWKSIILAVAAIFIIVGTSMLYSTKKIKKENIIEALKQENI